MRSKLIFILFGFILGIIACLSIKYLLPNSNDYYLLKKNYNIQNVGTIKAGTIIKYDKSFQEGFCRYILYLNISDAESLDTYKSEKKDLIIPYWLREIDTLQISK